MKVVIVAKTRMGSGACVGGLTFEGRSVRLIPAEGDRHEGANLEYNVGEVWEVDFTLPPTLKSPHVEDIIVRHKQPLARIDNLVAFIEQRIPPLAGGPEVLFYGQARPNEFGTLRIAQETIPPFSTMFWRPDRPLQRDSSGKRLRYRYPTPDGGCTLTFVGFQEPVEMIPAGTLLRVSLSHWWRPPDHPEEEEHCYVQLSGWISPSALDTPPVMIDSLNDYAKDLAAEPVPDGQADPATLLRQIFGYDGFRPLQREIIENVLQKRDTLVVMPTGGGKSLCYQLPALLFPGLTVVVSPLISLMQDQVTQLREIDYPAAYLNSTLDHREYVAITRRVKRGEIQLLYIAPESLLRPEILVMLQEARLDCLAIDEAHCISAWGHDFRPEYRQLLEVRRRFPQAVCLALTATATPQVRQDIQQTLNFQSRDTFLASFDRPNLFLDVQRKTNLVEQALEFIQLYPNQSGIIYCNTQKRTEELAAALVQQGVAALAYHGGMDNTIRARNQNAFIYDETPVMVATIAFGMGIDKSNVRFILHADLPQDVESYYQQIGRAGRDGLAAHCRLLYSFHDTYTLQYLIEKGAPDQMEHRRKLLRMMVDWADTGECRRRRLLAYFDEVYSAPSCDNCDNCRQQANPTAPETTDDLTILVQKFLSCVKRTGERFGVNHIILVLRGSRAKSVLQFHHDNISTYGIGQELSESQWQALAQQFLQLGLVTQDRETGGIRLTTKGYAVLKGEPVLGQLPGHRRASTALPLANTAYDTALFDRLRELRQELASQAGLPAYIIFPDQTLLEMATYFPQTADSLARMHGVGQVKLERYAGVFLSTIRTYCSEKQISERRKPVATDSGSRQAEVIPAFEAGASMIQLMERFQVKRGTIINYLDKAVRQGHLFPVEQLLAASELQATIKTVILAAFAKLGSERLWPLFDYFDEKISYDELKLLRLVFWLQSPPEERPSSPTYQEQLQAVQVQYPKAYAPWEAEEEVQLATLYREGRHVNEIAAALQRQTGAIRSRLRRLGLVD
ncbi:MAG: DNA helicase RecQ [Chloroflexi bacterium]|nr:DNA helicase RecQ [Chloroflexota bacterium]